MSSVRMCDRCGTIFSENAEDWSTFSGVRRIKDKATGRYVNDEIQQDACPRCTAKIYEPVGMAAIQNGVDDRLDRMADTIDTTAE